MLKSVCLKLVPLAVLLAMTSCGFSVADKPDKITIHSGDGQCAAPGSRLEDPLEVTVLSKVSPGLLGGKGTRYPVAGVPIAFEGIRLDDPSDAKTIEVRTYGEETEWAGSCVIETDAGGRARVYAKLPKKAGQFLVQASFTPPGESEKRVIFRASSGVSMLGDGQEGAAGSALDSPIQVLLKDSEGKPVKGAYVRFMPGESKHPASVSPSWAETDDDGLAGTKVTLPAAYTGTVAVAVEVTGANGLSYKGLSFSAMAVDGKLLLLGLIGGLAVFLYGMKLMSDGLQRVAGKRLRKILAVFTRNRFVGVLVGAGVTAVVQSSSATTVMLVGFVNAGLVGLTQAIGVIFGANIGTTATAQIIAFNLDDLALPAIAVGFVMSVIIRHQKVRFWGQVCLGFGFLFLGLSFMGDFLKPLRHSPTFQAFFELFNCEPAVVGGVMPPLKVLGAIFIGTALTVVVQSSSATVGLTMALASSGLINFYTAVPIILGDNIGTTITAILASLTANRRSKQAALAHTMFNVWGAAYMFVFFFVRWNGEPIFLQFIEHVTSGKALGVSLVDQENIARKIAMAHTFFNVFNVILFLPLVGPLAAFVSRIIRVHEDDEEESRIQYLEPHLLDTPGIALEQVWRELAYMARLGRKSTQEAYDVYRTGDLKGMEKIKRREDTIDNLQQEITAYLVELSQRTLTDEESALLPILMHCVNDLERIGDQAENIGEIAERRVADKLQFTDESQQDLDRLFGSVGEQFQHLEACLETKSRKEADLVGRSEERTDWLVREADEHHVKRLEEGRCNLRSAIVFRDMTAFLERIGDHIQNVAERLRKILDVQEE